MTGNVWVVAEHWRGRLSDLTLEGLALGRELAGGLGSRLEVVLLGHGAQSLAAGLSGADAVLSVDHPSLAEPNPEAYCQALVALVEARRPAVVLVPLSNVAADVIGLLPARLQAPLVNFCRDARIADGKLEARCLLYGGKLEATATVAAGPAIVGLLPGSRPAAGAAGAAAAPAAEPVAVELPSEGRVRFEAYLDPAPGDVDVTQQPVLVSVGRGIQTQDNIALAEDLAAALGGAVSASRPVIDQGWLPLTRQVGKSGATVKPKLYFAAGISGAPEHVEGMKGAELIIAVNTDPGAPIFGVAHYGIVGDALEVLPALTEAVKARKG